MTTEEIYEAHLTIEKTAILRRGMKELATDHTKLTIQAEIDKLIWASDQVYDNLDDTKMAIEIHIEQLKKELKEYTS